MMERLTFDGNFCDIAQCREMPCPYNNRCTQREVWERLKAYEDSGVSPKACAQALEMENLLADEYYSMNRMLELLKADKEGRMDLLPWYGVLELAKHCEDGARKYGERNIDKGAPLHSLLDSGARHLAKYIAGETDEDHLRAVCWNLMWALQQRTTHPELNDMPWGKDKP